MRLHKIKAGETAGTYLIESPVTEADILLMAKQLASRRLRRGRQLTAPRDVFNHLQTLSAPPSIRPESPLQFLLILQPIDLESSPPLPVRNGQCSRWPAGAETESPSLGGAFSIQMI